jgi:hypothetical protein
MRLPFTSYFSSAICFLQHGAFTTTACLWSKDTVSGRQTFTKQDVLRSKHYNVFFVIAMMSNKHKTLNVSVLGAQISELYEKSQVSQSHMTNLLQ